MRWILIILWMNVFFGGAQILDNSSCKAFTDEPFFSNDFIKTNKIQSIRGEIFTKVKLAAIRTQGLKKGYDFNIDGQLTAQFSTSIGSKSMMDTTFVKYAYNKDNAIVTKRRNDKHGFYSYNYTYDSLGLQNSEKYCRDENANTARDNFKLGKQFVIVSEACKNEWLSAKELKKRYFNNYNKPYQEVFYRWDDKGYLFEEETVLLLNSKRNKVVYEYNDKGLVMRRYKTSSVAGNSKIEFKYNYDEVGNLTEIDEYRNGKHITNKEIIYDGKTMLMDAVIIMDVATEYMKIVRYYYTFFED